MAEPGAPSAAPVVCGEVAVPGAGAMRSLGVQLARLLRRGDLIVLGGPLGAGKTTLVQGIAEGLGVRGPVTSPTFVIARVHPSLHGGPGLVHADAYRLGSRLEVDDLDLDAELQDCVTVVEGGEGLVEDLAPDWLRITIGRPAGGDGGPGEGGGAAPGAEPATAAPGAELGDELRQVLVAGYGARWQDAAEELSRVLSGPCE